MLHKNLVALSSTNPKPKPAQASLIPAKGRATWVPSLEN